MTWNWTTIIFLLLALDWAVLIIMLFIIPTNRKPSSATAWLMLILLLPYLGLVIFLLLGSPKLSKRRRAQQHTMDDLIAKAVAEAKTQTESAALVDPEIPPLYEPYILLNTNLGNMPAFSGNSV